MKVEFIERKISETTSIESVFRQVAKGLEKLGVETSFVKVPFGHSFFEIVKNMVFFKWKKADIYHITGHIHYMGLVLPPDRTVLTIHDLVILRMRKGFRRFVLKQLLFDLPVRRLKYITVISENTKRELIEATGCAEEKIRVIENPLREEFRQSKEREFNSVRPVILQVGTSAVKNLPVTIEALKGLNCTLRVIGPLTAEQKKLLDASEIDFENLVGLSDAELMKEYAGADLVSFCSTYEGFGLPIIEAQAAGTPLVTSDQSPMREVAGEGAILANPYDSNSIRAAIERVIGDARLREELVEKGRRNIERFAPEAIAGNYFALYGVIVEAVKDNVINK